MPESRLAERLPSGSWGGGGLGSVWLDYRQGLGLSGCHRTVRALVPVPRPSRRHPGIGTSATSSIHRNFLASGYACGERSGISRRTRWRVYFPRLRLWSLPSGFHIGNTRFGLVDRPMQNGHQFRVDVQQKRGCPMEKTQSWYRPHRADCHVTSWKFAGFRSLRRKKNFLTVALDVVLAAPKSFVAQGLFWRRVYDIAEL